MMASDTEDNDEEKPKKHYQLHPKPSGLSLAVQQAHAAIAGNKQKTFHTNQFPSNQSETQHRLLTQKNKKLKTRTLKSQTRYQWK